MLLRNAESFSTEDWLSSLMDHFSFEKPAVPFIRQHHFGIVF